MKKGWATVTMVFALVLFMTSCVYAQIYSYRDSSGIMHFSNVPTSERYRSYMDEYGAKVSNDESSFDYIIEEAAREKEVPFHLIKAMIQVESSFDPNAISKKGAMGLMQIMPQSAEDLNISDPFDPKENIMGGTTYLKAMMTRFKGELELAIAAYNAGPTAVEKYSDIPPYQETIEYVEKVMAIYRRYRDV